MCKVLLIIERIFGDLRDIWSILFVRACLVVRLCDPMDGSPPGPSVHGISQARLNSRLSCLLHCRRILYQLSQQSAFYYLWTSAKFYGDLVWKMELLFFLSKKVCELERCIYNFIVIGSTSFFFFKDFYLFIYFWLWWVFAAAQAFFLAASGGSSPVAVRALLTAWLLLFQSTGSRCSSFNSCGSQTLEHRLSTYGTQA